MKIDFVLGKYALLDDFDMVMLYLEQALREGFPVNAIREWPLFKQFRETDQYVKIVNNHKEAFAVLGYEPEEGWIGDEHVQA